jgi:hypothetical protein
MPYENNIPRPLASPAKQVLGLLIIFLFIGNFGLFQLDFQGFLLYGL